MNADSIRGANAWRPPPPMCQFQVLVSGQPDLDDLTASAAEFGLRAEMGRFGPAGAAPPPSEIWPLVGVDPSIVDAIERSRNLVTLDIVEPAPQRLAQVLAATRLASDLAAEFDGVVFDLAALRHFHPGGWRSPFAAGDESILNHISLRVSPARAAGRFHAATTGLCKFGRPEFQVRRLRQKLVPAAGDLLLELAQYVAEGALVMPGDTVGHPDVQLRAIEDTSAVLAPLPLPALRLVDADSLKSPARGLRAWARSHPLL